MIGVAIVFRGIRLVLHAPEGKPLDAKHILRMGKNAFRNMLSK